MKSRAQTRGGELDRRVSTVMETATPSELADLVEAVAGWQHDGVPVQLHSGDLGWQWRMGAQQLARSLRVWRRGEEVAAVGMVEDDIGVIRMALSPAVDHDDAFAARLLDELPAEVRAVEARFGTAFRELLARSGWQADEPWTPLCRDLSLPVEEVALMVEVVDEQNVEERVSVQRSAFSRSTFTAEKWRTMAAAPPYRRARCLLGRDERGEPVAAVTVWSAGPGRPGLIEPMGVSREHRGHGYGTAITVAAAAALKELGSSTATVCTASSNVGGVATYVAAGFERLPEVTDFRRPDRRASAPDDLAGLELSL